MWLMCSKTSTIWSEKKVIDGNALIDCKLI